VRNAVPPGFGRLDRVFKETLRLVQSPISRELTTAIPSWDHGDGFGSPKFAPAIPLVHRISHIWIFHYVYQKVPEQVPYWSGHSYKPILTSIIPRFLYPDKPTETIGNEFGRRFGIILENQTNTSINLPWITELLANFGKTGVVWGMTLIGIFLAFLDRFFNSPGGKDLEFVIGLTLIFPLVYPESNFSVMTGSMPLLFLSLYAYFGGGTWLFGRFTR